MRPRASLGTVLMGRCESQPSPEMGSCLTCHLFERTNVHAMHAVSSRDIMAVMSAMTILCTVSLVIVLGFLLKAI